MRREALNRHELCVSCGSKCGLFFNNPPRQQTEQEIVAQAARKANAELLANEVYQEDIDDTPTRRRALARDKGKQKEHPIPPPTPQPTPKNKWHDHDPYRLPEVNVSEAVARATRSSVPDPRLATEDELRQFIDEMVPEDFDTNSEAFRSLSTELQYEIIGDLRLKSRQTSYARLQNMLTSAPTALDFSKAQIVNLKQRNELTQKLLATIETVGRTKYTIMPTRIASERNRQYVLMRNKGADGGWVLGIRDEGSVEKPIDVDEDGIDDEEPTALKSDNNTAGDSDDDDDDMEEILPNPYGSMSMIIPSCSLTSAPSIPIVDPDMREYRQSLALEALSRRDIAKHFAPLRVSSGRNPLSSTSKHSNTEREPTAARPLFLDEDGAREVHSTDEDDPSFKEALHRSITDSEQREAEELSIALAESAAMYAEAEKEDQQRARQFHSSRASAYSGSTYVTLMSRMDGPAAKFAAVRSAAVGETSSHIVTPTKTPSASARNPLSSPTSVGQSAPSPFIRRSPTSGSPGNQANSPSAMGRTSPLLRRTSGVLNESRPDAVIYTPKKPRTSSQQKGGVHTDNAMVSHSDSPATEPYYPDSLTPSEKVDKPGPNSSNAFTPPLQSNVSKEQEIALQPAAPQSSTTSSRTVVDNLPGTPPRPTSAALPVVKIAQRAPHYETFVGEQEEPHTREEARHLHNEWDAAEEIDVAAEQAQFASFFSQVQNRSVDQLREEIDQELRALQAQKKAAMRDSDDITQQMVGQIQMMLRLFGIPYVTAPMEAEAQCATLVALGLVEGIITDDSDVFLFGGERVYRNMFNQSKTVECFLAADLARELGLDRDSLVRLACLLGSDYTDGLPGVGPVIAMELLKEFPGEDGLHCFKDWWRKVQSGRDLPDESGSPFRHRFVGAADASPCDSDVEVGTS